MSTKGEIVEIGGRCFLVSASILFDTAVYGTHCIGSVLEYGSVCFTNMACWSLERVQNRALRIALDLMGSTLHRIIAYSCS
jgi:hypothetical protein